MLTVAAVRRTRGRGVIYLLRRCSNIVGINPTLLNPAGQPLLRFWIDVALAHQAPERQFQVVGGASELFVKLEMPARGVNIIAPQKGGDAPTRPHTLRQAGGAGELCGFGKLLHRAALGIARRLLFRSDLLRLGGLLVRRRGLSGDRADAGEGEGAHKKRGTKTVHDGHCVLKGDERKAIRSGRLEE